MNKCAQKYVIIADSNYVFNFDFRGIDRSSQKEWCRYYDDVPQTGNPEGILKPNSNYNELYYTLDTDGDKVKKYI